VDLGGAVRRALAGHIGLDVHDSRTGLRT
jgi:hypothetical protein